MKNLNLNILVTGGTGFLGSYIASELESMGFENIYLLSRSKPDTLKFNHISCDLSKASDVKEVFSAHQFDVVFHTAAKAGVWGREEDFISINFEGTKNLLASSKEYGVKQFIYTSTPSVVFDRDSIINGNEDLPYPESFLTFYAKSKALAEKEVLKANQLGFQTAALRPHLIWGNGDNHIVPRIIERYRNNKVRQIGNGENLVDVIHVKNAAHAHILVFKKMIEDANYGGRAYFIGQLKPVNLWSFIKSILELKFKKVKLRKIPAGLAYMIGTVSEKIYNFFSLKGEPMMTRFVSLQLSKSHYFSHQRAIDDFGYKEVISTEEGLKELKSFVDSL